MHDRESRNVPIDLVRILRGRARVHNDAYEEGRVAGAAGLKQSLVGVPLLFKQSYRDGWVMGRVEWTVARAFRRARAAQRGA